MELASKSISEKEIAQFELPDPFDQEISLDMYISNPKTGNKGLYSCILDPYSFFDLILPLDVAQQLGLDVGNPKKIKEINFLMENKQKMIELDRRSQNLSCSVPYRIQNEKIVTASATAVYLFVYEKLEMPFKGIKASEPIILGRYLLDALFMKLQYDEHNDAYKLSLNRDARDLEEWDLSPLDELLHILP